MTNLPKLESPIYFLTIPSTGKKIKYRPFLVKEEKIILIALQEMQESPQVLFETIKQIIDNCTFKQLDISTLTTFDIEYIFLQLRIKSKGHLVDLSFRCSNTLQDGSECNHVNVIQLDLTKVEVKNMEDFSLNNKTIILDESRKLGLVMRYPNFDTMDNLQKIATDQSLSQAKKIEGVYNNIPDYIDSVFEGDVVYDSFTKAELSEWIDNLTEDQFEKIENFFNNIPKLSTELEIKCQKCEHKEDVTIEGLQNFLA